VSEEIVPGLTVSRETAERLRAFASDVLRWTQRINLVAKGTAEDIWTRHVRDSAQCLVPITRPGPLAWVDLGSGGGFPGLVLAIILAEIRPEDSMTLVESDQRKAAFLLQASMRYAPKTQVRSQRIEDLSPANADIITARALAPLPRLLPLVHRHAAADATIVLPKGRRSSAELAEAQHDWQFSLAQRPSLVDPDSTILILTSLRERPRA
jgi:16S rRNA (guanine527-N7)-methyltransferase